MSKASEFLLADGWKYVDRGTPCESLWRNPEDGKLWFTSEAIEIWRKHRWPEYQPKWKAFLNEKREPYTSEE